jgi:PTH1 family peptidyl-tRNA hydrolase
MMNSLFVASLGNPAPYHQTLHSAGHILLRALGAYLQCPIPKADRELGKAFVTHGRLANEQRTNVTLWESPSVMNVSGPPLLAAYRAWLKREGISSPVIPPQPNPNGRPLEGRDLIKALKNRPQLVRPSLNLVLLHDELDLVPGKIRTRFLGGEASSRGHNGVKSVVAELIRAKYLNSENAPGMSWYDADKLPAVEEGQDVAAQVDAAEDGRIWPAPVLMRVQVGIGRPGGSRDSAVVASHVLSTMCDSQMNRTCAQAPILAQFLEQLIAPALVRPSNASEGVATAA